MFIFFPIVAIASALAIGWFFLFVSDCPAASRTQAAKGNENFFFQPWSGPQPSKLIVFIPGALNSIDIFSSAASLRDRGYSMAFYKMPGVDGRKLDQQLKIEDAANEVLEYIKQSEWHQVFIVGFSLGGQVALAAAAKGKGKISKVAILSGYVGFPDTLGTSWRTVSWLVGQAWREKSTNFSAVWKKFYKVLLFGDEGISNVAFSRRADEIIAARSGKIITPNRALVCSHMKSISMWAGVPQKDVGKMPVLFIHGEHDIVSKLDRVSAYAEGFSNSKLIVLDQQGHQIFLTEPRLFEMVDTFFAQ